MFFEPLEARQMMTIVPVEGTPFWDFPGNYRPPQTFLADTGFGSLSSSGIGDAQTIALNYMRSHASQFGLSASDLNDLIVTNRYTDDYNGVTHIYWQQTFNGLPIADATMNVNVTRDGKILTAGVDFVPGLPQLADSIPTEPEIFAYDAVLAFATGAGLQVSTDVETISSEAGGNQQTIFNNPDVSRDPIPVKLQYVPSPEGGIELSWQVIARLPTSSNWLDAGVAAAGPRAGTVIRVADWSANASYNVIPRPTEDLGDGSRVIVVNPQDSTASPFGWHDNNGVAGPEFTDTRGNNVIAQDDTNGDDLGGTRPNGTATLDFNSPLVLPAAPNTYLNAAITQVFYATNIASDVAYHYGFNELSGNFRQTNYSGLGVGGDPVIADSQDPTVIDNATFQTPPDGISPRLQAGISTFMTPSRDYDLDNVVLFHEFGHGISNRLTGGPANSNALQGLQSGGMGEGWSDWFGMLLTLKATDNKNTPLRLSEWNDGPGGIRRFPYSYNLATNPLKFSNYNGDQFPQQNNTEVHNAGEIWAVTLLDMTWLLIDKYGFDSNAYTGTGGNNVAMQIVFDAMKLQPANPTFVQARDAILAADRALTGGANTQEIWSAFSRRGLGLTADAGADADSLVVNTSFVQPSFATGTIYNDTDKDGVRDASEAGLSGWTVYNDTNNNGQLDFSESSTTTSSTGTYQLALLPNTIARIREVVMPNWTQFRPESGAHLISTFGGQNASALNFANHPDPGEIHGTVYTDFDGDGTRDTGDNGLEGIIIYVDLDNNGKISILEPAGTTDRLGRYQIKGVAPGTGYIVRAVVQPGVLQISPGPTGTGPGVYTPVIVVSDVITPNIDFGFQNALDFGDAPTAAQSGFAQSYPTTLAQNGARHGLLAGFGLGTGTTALQFRPGETTKTVTINVAGDFTVEQDEAFQIALTNANGATIRTAAAFGAILNDDSATSTTIAIGATNGTIAEGNTGNTAITFTVYRNGDLSGASSVNYTVDGGGSSPADLLDFAGGAFPTGTVTFAAGENSQVVTLNFNGDIVFEPDEGYTVTLSAPTGGTISLDRAVGTILNDDGVGPPTLSIAAVDAVKPEGFSTTAYTFVITRGGDTSGFSTVEFIVAGFGANPATADDFAGGVFPSQFALVDAEPDGQPSPGATGDGPDDNGVILSGLTPGVTATATVTVSLGGYTAGYLQGFIDWNRDGDWDDAGEQIISDRQLPAGTTNVLFTVPANASLGTTFARFRYGYERGLGPTGAALAGEVEDYRITLLDNAPFANADFFGAAYGTPPIKQGSSSNRLDVLANDFGILQGNPPILVAPTIDTTTLPVTTAGGGTVSVVADATLGRNVIVYTPAASTIGSDTFQYRVTAGGLFSDFATVTIDVTASDPKAVDDVRTVAFAASLPATPQPLPGPALTANDLSPDSFNTRITNVTRLTTDPATFTAIANISVDGQTINFLPPAGFRGTIIYSYTIDDLDPNTSPSTANVTVQVVDVVGGVPLPATAHLAQFGVEFFQLDGSPATMVAAGDDFFMRIYTEDLRGGGGFFDRGVLAAYMDVLFNSNLAEPVLTSSNLLGFDIAWALDQNVSAGASVVQAAPAPTSTSFSGSNGLPASDGALERTYVQFTTGALAGQSAQVLSYVGATRTFTFATGAFTAAPSPGDGFDIRTPIYSFQQSGQANVPAPGAIDEVGGSYFSPTFPGPGKGQVPAFTVRMRAKSPGTLDATADPADSDANPDNRVVLPGLAPPGDPPLVIADEQVFYKPGALTILGSGEGEFTNFSNPLDVSSDGYVSALDALMVINEINSIGARSVSRVDLASSGALPPQNYLDVNADAYITPIDALIVINYLNYTLASSGSGGEGEGVAVDGGEGEAAPSTTTASAANLLVATTTPSGPAAATGNTAAAMLIEAPEARVARAASSLAPRALQSADSPLAKRMAKLAADATDEVFADLGGELRQNLRNRLNRR